MTHPVKDGQGLWRKIGGQSVCLKGKQKRRKYYPPETNEDKGQTAEIDVEMWISFCRG